MLRIPKASEQDPEPPPPTAGGVIAIGEPELVRKNIVFRVNKNTYEAKKEPFYSIA